MTVLCFVLRFVSQKRPPRFARLAIRAVLAEGARQPVSTGGFVGVGAGSSGFLWVFVKVAVQELCVCEFGKWCGGSLDARLSGDTLQMNAALRMSVPAWFSTAWRPG